RKDRPDQAGAWRDGGRSDGAASTRGFAHSSGRRPAAGTIIGKAAGTGGGAMATTTATETRTAPTVARWVLRGTGYEFCNCDFGCGCNFGGFPNSEDGSCRALVGMSIEEGRCGDVGLSGVRCAAVLSWPKAIHEGNGRCVFVVDPETTDRQVEALAQIFTGRLGGLPWEILGPTFEV